jgi:serine/threonine protein kinase
MIQPGRQLLHYVVGEKLGEGAMGVVYKGTDIRLKRPVALKFLTKALPTEAAERKRFLREAQNASAINHPNVCTVHAIEESEGEEFLVMEFVEGWTLRRWMNEKRASTHGRAISVRDVLALTLQVAAGLDAAHEKGIIHRDVKPENVMVNNDGRVKIMDFGLAKLLGQSRLTRTGATIGTVAYMSPEQVQGGELDQRTDIYSFGVLLYEMLSGGIPFEADHVIGMMYAIVNSAPKALSVARPGISPALERVISKCMAREKGARYASMKEVIRDLSVFEASDRTMVAPKLPAFSTQKSWLRKDAIIPWIVHRKGILLGVLIVVLLSVVMTTYVGREFSPVTATVSVVSDPPGSNVWINGREVGITPLYTYRVPAGTVNLRLQLANYTPVDTVVTLEGDQHENLLIGLHWTEMGGSGRESENAITGKTLITAAPADTAAVTPKHVPRPMSVEDLATTLVIELKKDAPPPSGSVSVQPFTYQDTQVGSKFSLYFKSLVEARLAKLTSWPVEASFEPATVEGKSNAVPVAYVITGQYWQQSGQMRFFAHLFNHRTGQLVAQSDLAVTDAEMKRTGQPWTPLNVRQTVEEVKKWGAPVKQTGGLRLEVSTNKGAENLIFHAGDTLRTYVKVNRPCSIRVFYLTADGTHIALTGPDRRDIDSSLVNVLIPVDSSICTEPFGAEAIEAFATTGQFEKIQTHLGTNDYYVLDGGMGNAIAATRGIRKIGGSGLVEKRLILTTLEK